jgi:hypothetical protein
METVKQALLYAIMIAAFYASVIAVKKYAHVHVPAGYSDINSVEDFTSYRLDKTITFPLLRVDDPVCYALDQSEDRAVTFGWVAALPGDDVAISKGAILINGVPTPKYSALGLPDTSAFRVPAQHVWVVSDHHQADSFAVGPIPAMAIHGRLAHLP